MALTAPTADAAPAVTSSLPGVPAGAAADAAGGAQPGGQPGTGAAAETDTLGDPVLGTREPRADERQASEPQAGEPLTREPSTGETAAGEPGAGDRDAASSASAAAAGPDRFDGYGFDTCVTPSLATMRAWKSSRYRSIGVYYGGRGRGCPNQPELTRDWVSSVYGMGWKVLPVFVGSQSPCVAADSKRKVAIGSDPAGQGAEEARDAVEQAGALGMVKGSPLYLDMEAYDQGDRDCAATTLSFIRSWDREVERLGYVAGFYSSADSGVAQLGAERRAGTSDLPSVMWFARWNGEPSVAEEPSLRSEDWSPHQRIHQYAGEVKEEHGGQELTIDRNRVDAPVARIAD
ncbi:DUF1906 domain-containing protein [Streptomyces sp. NPDC059398]|uniref:DUF1906 domain-containing protein n=1 Tax=Streptomyces sp. NPDC059398 TaxID=3346820 RepID=UPI00367BDD38